ncbi:YceD family protein [Marinobacter sp. C2H3]|uniref:YceD family protein n=1 Tax=Marinobacter sp. C2H3 TaxID=3119003 RepID=UPI00300E6EC5
MSNPTHPTVPSNAELPKSVNPYRLAEQNVTLEGEVPLAALSRFRDAVFALDGGEVCQVRLTFGRDRERRYQVEGTLDARVTVECQRCMGPMPHPLTSEFRLGLVISDEQAQQLPRDLEPFLTDEDAADLWTLVEDELLLILPPFPLHERSECPAGADVEALEAEAASADETPPAENPFSVLAELKKTKH